MFSRIHEKLGTAGLVVAVVALVAALAGTAFAAAGLSGKQKREVKKIAKRFAGKHGAAGPAGPQGPTGPAGPAGANGKDGTNGTNGTDGTDGTDGEDGQPGQDGEDGKSVVTGTEAAGANCAAGGVWVEVEGSGTKKYVCNGTNGTSAGSQTVLEEGETSTGVWSFDEAGAGGLFVNISFPLRVEPAPTFHWVGPAHPTPDPACPGTVDDPEAEPGALCVYAGGVAGTTPESDFFPRDILSYTTDPTSGFVAEFGIEEGEEAYGYGSWAVQAAATP